MNLKTKANLREQILGGIVILALLMLFFRVVVLPQQVEKEKKRGQHQALLLEKNALEKFNLALQERPITLRKEAPRATPALQVLHGERAAMATEVPELLAKIVHPAFLKGVTLKEMGHTPPKEEERFKKEGFFLKLQGSYYQIIHYVERIEQAPAMVTLDHLTLKTIDPKAAQVDMELTGTLFAKIK